MNRILILAMLALMASTLSGCGQDPRVQALAGTAEVIVQGYRELDQAAAALAKQARTFCATPKAGGLDATRQRWDGAMGAWMRVQPVRFGAIREDNRDYKLQFWPDPRDLVAADTDALVTGETELNAAAIARQSVAVQGLPALEYLLYPQDHDALALFQRQPRRCAALSAIATNLAATTRALYRDWSPEGAAYGARLTEYGDDARYADADAALAVVAASLAEAAHEVADRKLGRPLGRHSGGEPQPLALESRRARRSLANISDNLVGIQRLFTAGEAFGIDDLLRGQADNAALAERIQTTLRAARTQAADLQPPLAVALTTGADLRPYRAVLAEVSALDELFAQPLPAALGVTLGFNFNDGD